MRRFLVTGARLWSDEHLMDIALKSVVWSYRLPPQEITLVHGDAEGEGGVEGADRMAARLGEALGMQVDPHPANWPTCVLDCNPAHRRVGRRGEFCPSAGMRRNLEMIDTMSVGELCVAFALRSRSGTGQCARAARDAGLVVVDFGVDTTR